MYSDIISRFGDFSILVLGDLMIDCYLHGGSSRLAPEGPVPVVDILTKDKVLGGAANTAFNLKALGADITFCSIVGNDEPGQMAHEELKAFGIRSRLIIGHGLNTSVKTRVISDDQIIVRYDIGSEFYLKPKLENQYLKLIVEEFDRHDAIVISDYNKGLITNSVISLLTELNLFNKKFIAVDSKKLGVFAKLAPTLVKPNYSEAIQLLNLRIEKRNRVNQISKLGKDIYQKTNALITAVSMDREGSIIFEKDKLCYRSFAIPSLKNQVSGAGDAYFSALTLSLLSCASIQQSSEIAGAMAAVAITKKITATCSANELNAFLSRDQKIITARKPLKSIIELYKSQGKRVVLTNGCFDVLHSGHVNFLNSARELGDILIVGVNTDDSIRRLKGEHRPINKLQERIKVISGLGSVNHIIPFGNLENDEALSLIEIIHPDIYTKGGNHAKENLTETSLVEKFGGKIVILPTYPNQSTTLTFQRIRQIKI